MPLHRIPHPTLARNHAAGAAQAALEAAAGWQQVGVARADPDLGAVVVRSRDNDRLAVLRFARTDFGAAKPPPPCRGAPGCPSPFDPSGVARRSRRPRSHPGKRPADRGWSRRTSRGKTRAAPRRGLGPGIVAANAAAAIRVLHAATATETPVDEGVLRIWVDDPVTVLRSTAANPLRAGSDHAALDRIGARLREELSGRVLTTCLVHGDFWLGNVLTTAEGTVSGIVDWERAGPGVSALDVMTLVLTAQVHDRRREFGPVVRDLLRGDGFDPGEQRLLAGGPGAGELPERTVLLLTWLHHAASNLQKRNHYRSNPVWVTTNVHYVLEEDVIPEAWFRLGERGVLRCYVPLKCHACRQSRSDDQARRPTLVAYAACTGKTSLFFGTAAERPETRVVRELKASLVCAACPVLNPCRAWAREHGEYGYWGGESEEARAAAGYRTRMPRSARRPRRLDPHRVA